MRARKPARIVVALRGSPQTCRELAAIADEMVCAREPALFAAAGEWYRDFSPTIDDEVTALLRAASGRPRDA